MIERNCARIFFRQGVNFAVTFGRVVGASEFVKNFSLQLIRDKIFFVERDCVGNVFKSKVDFAAHVTHVGTVQKVVKIFRVLFASGINVRQSPIVVAANGFGTPANRQTFGHVVLIRRTHCPFDFLKRKFALTVVVVRVGVRAQGLSEFDFGVVGFGANFFPSGFTLSVRLVNSLTGVLTFVFVSFGNQRLNFVAEIVHCRKFAQFLVSRLVAQKNSLVADLAKVPAVNRVEVVKSLAQSAREIISFDCRTRVVVRRVERIKNFPPVD